MIIERSINEDEATEEIAEAILTGCEERNLRCLPTDYDHQQHLTIRTSDNRKFQIRLHEIL